MGGSSQAGLAPGMSGAVVGSTVLFALAHGLDDAAIEAATGLSLADLSRQDARFAEDVVPRIWQLLRARHPDEALTLRMAEAAPASFFGPLAYGAQFAPDLRRVLDSFVRFSCLLSTSLRIELSEERAQVAVVIAHPADELDAGAGAEVGLALGRRFVAEILDMGDAVVGVEFSHQPWAAPAAYEAFFAVPVRFGQPRTALCFDRQALDRDPPRPDPRLFAFIESHLRLASDELVRDDRLADVREAIVDNVARQDYAAEAVAQALGVSLRALQRRVSAEGTTLRKLLDDARCAQAKRLLGDHRLSVDEVAFILDYSDERAFRRAFKRMTGSSPAQFRRRGL